MASVLRIPTATTAQRTGITPDTAEIIYDTDLDAFYGGDGSTAGGVLLAGLTVSDGDKGDITVTSSGATWTIDAEAVTLAKMAHMATDSFLGRTTAATGDVEVLSKSDALTILNVEDGADVTDATNVNAAGATMNTDTDVSANSWVLDEDNMVSDSNTKVPTQQSVKAYVDASGGGNVSKVGTPVDNQVGVWTGDGTIEGATTLTFSGTSLDVSASSPRLRLADTGGGVDVDWDLSVDGSTNRFSIQVDSTNTPFTIDDGVNDGLLTLGVSAPGEVSVTGDLVVSGTVDGIDIATDVAANTAKVTNATHTGEVTGSGALTLDATAISNRTDTVITAADTIIYGDATDSGNLKKDTVQGILDLVTGPDEQDLSLGGSSSTTRDIDISGGTGVTLPAATTSVAGLLAATDKQFLVDEQGRYGAGGEFELPNDLVFSEQATHTHTPTATKAGLWVRNDTPNVLVFTDDAGNDKVLGDVTKVGTPVDNQVAVWTGDGTAEGDTALVFEGGKLGIGGVTPVQGVHIHSELGGGGAFSKYTNLTTGATSGDGFEVGYSNAAYLWNYENTAFNIANNSSIVLTISAGGDLLIPSGVLAFNNAYTVATLPGTPTAGMIAKVTDGGAALAWGATVTGGGSTFYMVCYNGTNWTVMGK